MLNSFFFFFWNLGMWVWVEEYWKITLYQSVDARPFRMSSLAVSSDRLNVSKLIACILKALRLLMSEFQQSLTIQSSLQIDRHSWTDLTCWRNVQGTVRGLSWTASILMCEEGRGRLGKDSPAQSTKPRPIHKAPPVSPRHPLTYEATLWSCPKPRNSFKARDRNRQLV